MVLFKGLICCSSTKRRCKYCQTVVSSGGYQKHINSCSAMFDRMDLKGGRMKTIDSPKRSSTIRGASSAKSKGRGKVVTSPRQREEGKFFGERLKPIDHVKPLTWREQKILMEEVIDFQSEKSIKLHYLLPKEWFRKWNKHLERECRGKLSSIDWKSVLQHCPEPTSSNRDLLEQLTLRVPEEIWDTLIQQFGSDGISIYSKGSKSRYQFVSKDNCSSTGTSTTASSGDSLVSRHQDLKHDSSVSEEGDDEPEERELSASLKPMKNEKIFAKARGLINISNYCYMNATLQCLASFRGFLEYFLKGKFSTHSSSRMAVSQAFFYALHGMFKESPKAVAVAEDLQRCVARRFRPHEQYDAHEFVRYMLSKMQDELNTVSRRDRLKYRDNMTQEEAWEVYTHNNNSKVDDLFAGQLRSSVVCSRCHHVSNTYDPFLDISISLPPRCRDINHGLEDMFAGEKISKSSGYRCEKCKMVVTVQKKFSISKFPRYLVVQFKRFKTQPILQKITSHISYPVKNFDLSNYASDSDVDCTYSLVGVICHRGSLEGGHYVSYGKRGRDWYHFNDSFFSKVEPSDLVHKDAYMLFYERNLS